MNLEPSNPRSLNEGGDILSDVAIYAPFARVAPLSASAVTAAVLLAVVSEVVGLVPALDGGVRRYDGPMGKSDRAVAFGVLAILVATGARAAAWAPAVLAAVVVLLAVTILKRAVHPMAEVRS